jgi:hypothetical protein
LNIVGSLVGLAKLEKVGWESDGRAAGWAVVEIHEEPTIHKAHVGKMLSRVKSPRRIPRDEIRKQKLRALLNEGSKR